MESLDLVDDGFEEQSLGGVAHPGVELAVGFVGSKGGIAKVVSGRLGFLGEGDHVWRFAQMPVFVRPEFAGRADACLDFVDDEYDVVAFCDFAETVEECWGSVVVAAFGLDGFDYDGCDWVVEILDQVFCFGKTAGFFGCVL